MGECGTVREDGGVFWGCGDSHGIYNEEGIRVG